MAEITVLIRLGAESAAFMRKCIGSAEGAERDAFFQAAIGALAQKLMELDGASPSDEDATIRSAPPRCQTYRGFCKTARS